MKLCTYNIWNHDTNYKKRMDHLIDLLQVEDVDILALQEVRSEEVVKRLAQACGFDFYHWKKYHDCQEGLAILSKYEILDTWTNWDTSIDVHNSGTMIVTIKYQDLTIGVLNVHLDHKHAENREIEICKLIRASNTLKADYKLMLGDFNCTPHSSVYTFLNGQSSLLSQDTKWIDLGRSFAALKGQTLKATLDYYKNPRWDETPVLDIPSRFDWILIENPYPNVTPNLVDYDIIGHLRRENITPSDHYGVTCVLNFKDILSQNMS